MEVKPQFRTKSIPWDIRISSSVHFIIQRKLYLICTEGYMERDVFFCLQWRLRTKDYLCQQLMHFR